MRTSLSGALSITFATMLTAGHAAAVEDTHDGSGAQGARWQSNTVRLTLDDSVNALAEDVLESVIGAVSVWQTASPSLPTMIVERGSRMQVGYDPKGRNRNVIRYMPEGSPAASGALAITIITFDREAKRILDADIIINGEHQFGIADHDNMKEGSYDIQNVLTHEVGHFLGLGEEYQDEHSTMYAYSLPGETEKRDLSSADADTLTQLYQEESLPQEVGCGGATIAKKSGKNSSWLFTLGTSLILIGFARQRSFQRHAKRAARALITLSALLALGDFSENEQHVRYASVLSAESQFEDGLIVTTLTLQPNRCRDCDLLQVRSFGGTVGNITQRIGNLRPPIVGETVQLSATRTRRQ